MQITHVWMPDPYRQEHHSFSMQNRPEETEAWGLAFNFKIPNINLKFFWDFK